MRLYIGKNISGPATEDKHTPDDDDSPNNDIKKGLGDKSKTTKKCCVRIVFIFYRKLQAYLPNGPNEPAALHCQILPTPNGPGAPQLGAMQVLCAGTQTHGHCNTK